MLLVSSTLFLPFPADQGYGDTPSTLAHRTVIQTALSAMLNQSTLGRTFTLLYVLALTLWSSSGICICICILRCAISLYPYILIGRRDKLGFA